MDGKTAAAEAEKTLDERLKEIIGTLHAEASSRVRRKEAIERRWISDLRQYHGLYDPEHEEKAGKTSREERSRSRQFVNLTRSKTNALVARLTDLLFPTDDRNWGIRPTPVPEIEKEVEAIAGRREERQKELEGVMAAGQRAASAGDTEGMQKAEVRATEIESEISEVERAHEELQAILKEARAKAELMQETIDDQLKACRYGKEARDAIMDACKIGTGIMKGPVVGTRLKTFWEKTDNEYALKSRSGDEPEFIRVDPWSFFPQMDARKIGESDGVFERHLMTRKQLRKLAQRDDIDKDAIRRLLRSGPKQGDVPNYLVELNYIGEQDPNANQDRYAVWEYTGALEADQIMLLAEASGNTDLIEDMIEEEIDPLQEMNVRVWFCQDELLAFAEHPLDSGEQLYSVFNIEEDETTMFGYGIPYLMRDSQRALNAAWRMMMDNGGITSGPQVIINKDLVTPEDGRWQIEPFKIWQWSGKTSVQGRENPFEAVNIQNNQVEMANIIALARKQMDEVTSMPAIAEGEQGANVTKTAQGMAMLMNSANIVFRRIVKNFDDDMTVPNIRRAYHWNMQFSDREEIKGDYDVDARGSSVLLVREMQAQNLMIIALQFGGHPVYGPMMDPYGTFKQIVKAFQIGTAEVMVSKREYMDNLKNAKDPAVAAAELQAAMAEEDRKLKREQIQADIEIANMRIDAERMKAQMQYDAVMARVAEAMNMKQSDLEAKIAMANMQNQSKERVLAAEIAMQQRTGKSSGGSV